MLTVARCEAMALQTLGNPEALPAEFSTLEIVNTAGRWLCSAHPWNWLLRLGTVDVTGAQNYVDLSGLRALTQVYRVAFTNSASTYLTESSLPMVQDLRTSGLLSGYPARYAVGTREAADGTLTKVLELDSPNSTSITNGVTVLYRCGWQSPQSGNDQARIAVPEDWEGIFLLAVRALARGYQEEDTATANLRLDALKTSSDFAALVRLDGMSQSNYGYMQGGGVAMQMTGLPQLRYPTSLGM